MDTVSRYRAIIEQVLTEYAAIPFSHGKIETQTVFDSHSDHYLLLLMGSEGVKRVHGCLVHIGVKDGKVWIHRDGTEQGMARELLAAGIPKDDIMLAFRVPDPPEPLSAVLP
ncbi:MAG TPA: XisI protein [Gemmataceae bacterium]|nr:XisI protein [Gemmataceae bacterium]